MKRSLQCLFLVIIAFMSSNNLFGQPLLDNKKFLEFENGNSAAKIVIIDRNTNQYEYCIDPGWTYGWSEELIGDFIFIYIKCENNLEGIFIIENKYEARLLPFDILTIEEFDRKMIAEHYENRRIMSYDITIKIIDNRFEIIYDYEKFNISLYYNNEEGYFENKEKYMKEYNYEEKE